MATDYPSHAVSVVLYISDTRFKVSRTLQCEVSLPQGTARTRYHVTFFPRETSSSFTQAPIDSLGTPRPATFCGGLASRRELDHGALIGGWLQAARGRDVCTMWKSRQCFLLVTMMGGLQRAHMDLSR